MAIPNMWRTKKQRYSLHGDVCDHCTQAVFPPRQVCPHCHKPMHGARAERVAVPAFDFGALVNAAPVMQQAMVGDD